MKGPPGGAIGSGLRPLSIGRTSSSGGPEMAPDVAPPPRAQANSDWRYPPELYTERAGPPQSPPDRDLRRARPSAPRQSVHACGGKPIPTL